MALTEQQKEENKAAKKVRDRAYTARRRMMRQAVNDAENHPDVVQALDVMQAADAEYEKSADHRDAQVRDLEAQIAAIEAKIAILRNSSDVAFARTRLRSAAEAWRAVKTEKVALAEAKFPDLKGVASYSPAAWEPPQDVRDAMERAKRTATLVWQ